MSRDAAGRRDLRYRPADHPDYSLHLDSAGVDLSLINLSSSALLCARPATSTAPGSPLVISLAPKAASAGSQSTARAPTTFSADSEEKQHGVLFRIPDFTQQGILARLIDEWRDMGLIVPEQDPALEPQVTSVTRRLETACGQPVLHDLDVLVWIRNNGLSTAEAVAAVAALSASLTGHEDEQRPNELKYFLSRTDCEESIRKIVNELRDEGFSTIHLVSMRPPALLGRLFDQLSRPLRDDLQKQGTSISYFRNLYDLQPTPTSAGPACLVALDICVNEGHTRNWFLSTLPAHLGDPSRFYQKVVILALVGFDSAGPLPSAPAGLGSVALTQRFGRSFTESDRPFATADNAHLHGSTPAVLDLVRDSLSLSGAPAHRRILDRVSKRSTFVCLETGCPPIDLPIFWSDYNWTPLWSTIDFYVPNRRPFPRAPFFSAYQGTLQRVLDRIVSGQSTLLHGPQGIGKTFLAARVVELCRIQSYYVLWHDCLDFDTIGNLLGHLDRFLDELGVGVGLSAHWPSNITSLVDLIDHAIAKLDRPVLFAFDRIQNVLAPQEGGRFWAFLTELTNRLSQHTDARTAGHHKGRSVCLLIHQTHRSNTDVHRAVIDVDTEVQDMLRELHLPQDGGSVTCPVDGTDVFSDSRLLADRLLRRRGLSEADRARQLQIVSNLAHCDPYRAWLLCFFLNRWTGLPDTASRALREHYAQLHTDLTLLHQLIIGGVGADNACHILSKEERALLECASVFELPWSIDDMVPAFSCALRDGPTTEEAGGRAALRNAVVRALEHLLEDHAPFIVELGLIRDTDTGELVNPRLRKDTDGWPKFMYCAELFEMPSVSKRYFRSMLDATPPVASAVYAAIARSMVERASRRGAAFEPPDAGEDTPLDDAEERAFAQMQAIYYFCQAGLPTEAASLYLAASEPKSWDRTRDLGNRILAADRDGGSDALNTIRRCQVTERYATALMELMLLDQAKAVCEAELLPRSGRESPDVLSRARLQAVTANCMRYAGDYAGADRLLGEIQSTLQAERRGPEHDELMAAVLGRRAQCAMSVGDCALADSWLEAAAPFAPRAERLLDELTDRKGTVALIRGNLDSAERLITPLLEDAPFRSAFAKALAHYRLARILLERLRATYVPLPAPASQSDKQAILSLAVGAEQHLRVGERQLMDARSDDARWHPAVRLAMVELSLLQARYGLERDIDSLDGGLKSVSSRLGAGDRKGRLPNSRRLELDTYQTAHDVEREVSRAIDGLPDLLKDSAEKSATSLRKLVAELLVAVRVRFDDVRQQHGDNNPYQQGRSWYEQLLCLWRLQDSLRTTLQQKGASWWQWLQRQDEATRDQFLPLSTITSAMCDAYRQGAESYYRHDLFQASEALHRLANCAFPGPHGLQERFEASFVLRELEGDRSLQKRGFAIQERMIEITRQYVRHWHGPIDHDPVVLDPFFSIPVKVYSRLIGDSDQYDRIASLVDRKATTRSAAQRTKILAELGGTPAPTRPTERGQTKTAAAAAKLITLCAEWYGGFDANPNVFFDRVAEGLDDGVLSKDHRKDLTDMAAAFRASMDRPW